MNKNKIYLIGLAGSGKTKVGKILAERLNFKFIDINTEIEKNALMFLDEIVNHYGEKTINNAEIDILSKLNDENIVVACNDGIVNTRGNKKLLDGIVIYLDVDNKILEKRLEEEYPKVSYQDISVADLAQKRFLLYRDFATHIISNNSNDIIKTVDSILDILQINKY